MALKSCHKNSDVSFLAEDSWDSKVFTDSSQCDQEKTYQSDIWDTDDNDDDTDERRNSSRLDLIKRGDQWLQNSIEVNEPVSFRSNLDFDASENFEYQITEVLTEKNVLHQIGTMSSRYNLETFNPGSCCEVNQATNQKITQALQQAIDQRSEHGINRIGMKGVATLKNSYHDVHFSNLNESHFIQDIQGIRKSSPLNSLKSLEGTPTGTPSNNATTNTTNNPANNTIRNNQRIKLMINRGHRSEADFSQARLLSTPKNIRESSPTQSSELPCNVKTPTFHPSEVSTLPFQYDESADGPINQTITFTDIDSSLYLNRPFLASSASTAATITIPTDEFRAEGYRPFPLRVQHINRPLEVSYHEVDTPSQIAQGVTELCSRHSGPPTSFSPRLQNSPKTKALSSRHVYVRVFDSQRNAWYWKRCIGPAPHPVFQMTFAMNNMKYNELAVNLSNSRRMTMHPESNSQYNRNWNPRECITKKIQNVRQRGFWGCLKIF